MTAKSSRSRGFDISSTSDLLFEQLALLRRSIAFARPGRHLSSPESPELLDCAGFVSV